MDSREPETEIRPQRTKLGDTHDSLCKLLKIQTTTGELRCYVHTASFPGEPKRLAEIFIRCDSAGSTLRGTLDAFGIVMSIALQSGVPLGDLTKNLVNSKFEPSGMTGNPEYPIAKSFLDYIARYLVVRYPVGTEDQQPV